MRNVVGSFRATLPPSCVNPLVTGNDFAAILNPPHIAEVGANTLHTEHSVTIENGLVLVGYEGLNCTPVRKRKGLWLGRSHGRNYLAL